MSSEPATLQWTCPTCGTPASTPFCAQCGEQAPRTRKLLLREVVESQIREEATAFFDEFVEAFGSFDGKSIARRYLAPYMARHVNGSIEVFDSGERIAGYFQRIVDGYRGRDSRACRYKDLEARPIGSDAVLCTVTWELLRSDGSVLASWRESYGLARSEGRLRVFVSIDHAAQAFE